MTIRPKLRPRTAAAAVLAALSLTWLAPSAQADAPAAVPFGPECGFHTVSIGVYAEAHYRHCTSEPYAVQITVYHGNGSTHTECVAPKVDRNLGPYGPFGVIYASYNGNLC